MGGWSAMLFWWDLMSQWQNCLSPWTSREISQYRGAQVSLLATRALPPSYLHVTSCSCWSNSLLCLYPENQNGPCLSTSGCFCSFTCFVLSLTLLVMLVVPTLCMILDRSFLPFCCFWRRDYSMWLQVCLCSLCVSIVKNAVQWL